MRITLASSKGGVGKSTLTACLAGAWAAQGKSVHIVDLDNNKTVSRWFSDAATRPQLITVSTPHPGYLTQHLQEIEASTDPDMILIDVAGAYEQALTTAAARSHLTLIPAGATEPDIHEAARVVQTLKQFFKQLGGQAVYRIVLNRVPPIQSNGNVHSSLQIAKRMLSRLKTRVMHRAAYEEVGLTGQPPHFADRSRPTIAKAVAELEQVRGEIDDLLRTTLNTTLKGAA